jgi:glutamate synthase (NADPH/NADH) small chain
MANMRKTRIRCPSRTRMSATRTFKEVTLGYTAEMAIDEAKRCLNCKNPACMQGCPVHVHIPEFIAEGRCR